jgi:hypothetical protein
MSPTGLYILGALGLIGGWAFHQVTDTPTSVPPQVPWAQPLALLLVACILGWTAWATRRTIAHHPGRLSPHRAVNRLVLARAGAYVGSLAAGFYFGYAISWLGVSSSDMAGEHVLRASAAGVAGLLVVAGGLLLERACRVPPEGDEP